MLLVSCPLHPHPTHTQDSRGGVWRIFFFLFVQVSTKPICLRTGACFFCMSCMSIFCGLLIYFISFVQMSSRKDKLHGCIDYDGGTRPKNNTRDSVPTTLYNSGLRGQVTEGHTHSVRFFRWTKSPLIISANRLLNFSYEAYCNYSLWGCFFSIRDDAFLFAWFLLISRLLVIAREDILNFDANVIPSKNTSKQT